MERSFQMPARERPDPEKEGFPGRTFQSPPPGPWPGYFITAYGLAVKHGFVGSEEEWLASLRGPRGETPIFKYDEEQDKLLWKYEDEEEGAWRELIGLDDLRGEVFVSALEEVRRAETNAKDSAGAAAGSAESAGEALKDAEAARNEAARAGTNAAKNAKEAAESAETAKQYSGKPPRIGEDGSWETWDVESGTYVSTGEPARGETGPEGPRGETGLTGETRERGPQGETGAPAGFGEVAATVDGESGVPSVEVSVSGPDTEKAFTFAFHGLKGEQGETGPEGPVGPVGPEGPEGPPGKDGTGTGDMEAAVYDPEGKAQDVFAYVDDAVGNVTIEMDEVPTAQSENAVKSGGVFEALGKKQDALTGTQGQVVGFDDSGKAVAQDAPESGVNEGTASNITGLIKGDGESVSAAVAGVDYVTPSGSITGNAGTADKLKTPRKINITGGATGSASFDGSGDITINVAVTAKAVWG